MPRSHMDLIASTVDYRYLEFQDTETLRDTRTSTYQTWENEENNKLNNHILQMNM